MAAFIHHNGPVSAGINANVFGLREKGCESTGGELCSITNIHATLTRSDADSINFRQTMVHRFCQTASSRKKCAKIQRSRANRSITQSRWLVTVLIVNAVTIGSSRIRGRTTLLIMATLTSRVESAARACAAHQEYVGTYLRQETQLPITSKPVRMCDDIHKDRRVPFATLRVFVKLIACGRLRAPDDVRKSCACEP